MKENNADLKQQKALNRVRQQFRRQCHMKLDEYLNDKEFLRRCSQMTHATMQIVSTSD